MGSIWHIGVAVPDPRKGRKKLVVLALGSPAALPSEVALADPRAGQPPACR